MLVDDTGMPTHESTIELTPEQVKRGQREHQFSLWVAEYRSGEMSEGEWQVLLQWDKFSGLFRKL